MPDQLNSPADHDDPAGGDDRDEHGGGGRPLEVVGAEHRRASGAEAARTVVAGGRLGMLATLTDRPAGFPFGSLVSYALDDAGRPLVVISTMAEHTRNAGRDPRASLLVAEVVVPVDVGHEPDDGGDEGDEDAGSDPLDAGRVTLLGELHPVPDGEQAAATARVVEAVPAVAGYAHFRDFACWRLEVEAVRWVGGFGAMGWVEVDDYRAARPDPVLAARRGVLAHMNADHADACLDIVAHRLGRADLATARMVAVDRYGCDYHVTPHASAGTREGDELAVRVPFDVALAGVDEVRMALVTQVRAARAAVTAAPPQRPVRETG